MADLAHARAAKSRLSTALATHDGICGVGLSVAGDGYALRVNVRSAQEADVPQSIDGVPVEVRVVVPIRPHDEDR